MTRGTATGNIVAGHSVDAVLTGHIGRKASTVLRSAGIRIYLGASGRVGKAIDNFKAGQYMEG